jgi:ADP-ribosylglycohydrolase
MYIAPVGLLCAGDPLKAELMAADVTAVNQHGRPRDVAGGYCAALAACFLPDRTVEDIVEIGIARTHDVKHVKEMRTMVDLAGDCGSCREFVERYYAEIIGPIIPYQDIQHDGGKSCVTWNSSEVLGPALATFRITGGTDAREMVLACCKIGRDADTIARVAGGLIGTWAGIQAIPTEWIDYVLPRNPWLRLEEKAAKLADLVRHSLQRDIAGRQAVLG